MRRNGSLTLIFGGSVFRHDQPRVPAMCQWVFGNGEQRGQLQQGQFLEELCKATQRHSRPTHSWLGLKQQIRQATVSPGLSSSPTSLVHRLLQVPDRSVVDPYGNALLCKCAPGYLRVELWGASAGCIRPTTVAGRILIVVATCGVTSFAVTKLRA